MKRALRRKAKIPDTIAFQTKPEIALEQPKAARTAGLPQGLVLMDAGYGSDTRLRTEITALAGIDPNTSIWSPGTAHCRRRPDLGRGRPHTRLQRDSKPQPITVKALALSPPEEAWQRLLGASGARIGSRRVLPGAGCIVIPREASRALGSGS